MTSIPWNRINTGLLLLVLLAIVGLFASRAYGGPLDPPGAPASTPGGIDGRIPIDHLPFTISQSGSYYLTKSLTGNGTNDGITVAASNVTVDLNGFTLDGATGHQAGVRGTGAVGITIGNGTVTNWSEGIDLGNSSGGAVRNIEASGNTNYAIISPQRGIVSGCTVHNNYSGVFVRPRTQMTGCSVTLSTGYGVVTDTEAAIERNVIEDNTGANVALSGTGITVADNDLFISGGVVDILDQGGDNVVIRNRVTTCSSMTILAGTYAPIVRLSGTGTQAVGLVNTNIALNPFGAGLC